jgi:pantoate--beta-alanine ligase
MIVLKKATDLKNWLDMRRQLGKKIGFVPTMGALHTGHISLIENSLDDSDVTVCSIFVNPTQFNDPKDFEKYPITIEKDIEMLEQAGCNALFLPSVKEMYPNGLKPTRHYELGFLETVFDGKFRPGHFQGVCMVVHRLLEMVMPDNLYLGQKDYQQCMVITQLVELIGLSNQVKINVCPTLRESDGLAMSSRNMRLSASEREMAPAIYQAMMMIKNELKVGNIMALKEKALFELERKGFKPDYLSIVDAKSLLEVNVWDGKQKLTVLVAAFLNEVRLIDNMILN